MRTLIVEDDFTSRLLLEEILKTYGPINSVDNGREAVASVKEALDAGKPYDLICLDIMMPEMDGQEALRKIREEEERREIASSNWVKIVMTTALDDPKNVIAAYQNLCDTYIIKPIQKKMLLDALGKLGLIE